MQSGLDFEGFARTLLQSATSYTAEWLPGGRAVGREYECALWPL